MPQVRRRPPKRTPSRVSGEGSVAIRVDTGVIDPVELAKLERSALSRDQAPTIAMQSFDTNERARQFEQLGPPFDAERIPMRQRRQMRKNPMLAFALHYKKVPVARAEWHIEARDRDGLNRQVSAFLDACLRRIYAAYIFQRTQTLDFGYKAIVKRFMLANPGGVYYDPLEENIENRVKPIWDEGNILPKIWDEPVGLRPELVEPKFIESGNQAGHFDGILYEVPPAQRTKAMGFRSTPAGAGKKNQGKQVIDVYHALWATNQKHDEDGNIYGWPITGYAREYWWEYNFTAGMNRRALERLAIPPILAFHPEGSTVVDSLTGARRENWDIALEMAERLRANAVAAVPSTMAESGMGETSSTQRAWDFKYMETPTEALSIYNERFNYLNVMLLRSLWVPDLALIGGNGAGGNSGGNIAEQMYEIEMQSEAILMEEIVAEIDRYMLPQLLWLNFPEFVNNGGSARMISTGFRKQDVEFYKQIIQLFGQDSPETLAKVDTDQLLKRVNLPLLDPTEYALRQQEIAAQTAAAGPPNVPGVTIRNPNFNPGSTNGGSVPEPAATVAGFANQEYIYFQPQDHIDLELAEVDDFLSGLPSSKHYNDKTIRALTVQLRRLWQSHFRNLYPEIAKHIKSIDSVAFEDNDLAFAFGPQGMLELASTGDFKSNGKKVAATVAATIVTKKQAEKAAKKIIDSFGVNSKVLKELAEKSAKIMRKMMERQFKLEAKETAAQIEIDDAAFDEFLVEQTGRLIKFTHNTIRDEVRDHLVNEIREGKTSGEIADGLVARFKGFDVSKADRVARSETRDAVNAATLISSEAAGIKYVKQRDGEEFDAECKKRNNTLATVKEAWRNLRKEHPYGTLGFEPIPRANFSVEFVSELPDEDKRDDCFAYFDDKTSTAFVLSEIETPIADNYLDVLSEKLIKDGPYAVEAA